MLLTYVALIMILELFSVVGFVNYRFTPIERNYFSLLQCFFIMFYEWNLYVGCYFASTFLLSETISAHFVKFPEYYYSKAVIEYCNNIC